MTEHERNRRDQLEVPWILVVSALVGVFLWGFTFLSSTKLDKVAFEQHEKAMSAMQTDIKAIQYYVENRSSNGAR